MRSLAGVSPLRKRKAFQNFLPRAADQGIHEIVVESSRAVARDANVDEEFFQKSKNMGVRLVPADLPDLFAPNPTPVQTFVRRVMFAMTELEKLGGLAPG